jgi:hypothetical protein
LKDTVLVVNCLVLLILVGSLSVIPAYGINRYPQSIDSHVVFTWSSSFQLPRGQLPTTLSLGLGIRASGLPNKVIPNEHFEIPVSVEPSTGTRFSIGDYQIDLDQLMPFALSNIPQEIDLKQFAVGITCAVATVTLEGTDAGIVCTIVREVTRYVKISLLNQLVVAGQVSGNAVLKDSVLSTWFGKSATFTLEVSSLAQRGEQLVLSFVSNWSVSLLVDFDPAVYDYPVVGALFRKMHDILHLPWQPSLGSAQMSATPSMTSLVLIPDFQLSCPDREVTLTQGQSSSLEVTATPIDEFDQVISLILGQVPQGVEAHLQDSQILPQSSTVVNLAVSDSAPPGDYQISVDGSGGDKSHQLLIAIHINERQSVPSPVGSTGTGNGQDQTGLLYGLVVAFIVAVGIAGVVARPRKRGPPEALSLRSQSRFCCFCGTQIPMDSRYCKNCGRDLT